MSAVENKWWELIEDIRVYKIKEGNRIATCQLLLLYGMGKQSHEVTQ